MNTIERLKDDHENFFDDEKDIDNVITEYFSSLFTSSNPSGVQEVANVVGRRVSDEMLGLFSMKLLWKMKW